MKIRFHRQARTAPDAIGGMKLPYAPAKRGAPQWRWYLILAVVLSPVAVLLLGLLGNFVVLSANGSVMLDQFEVRAALAGRVSELSVEPGSVVQPGAVVARVEDLASTVANVRDDARKGALRARPAVTRSSAPGSFASQELALRARTLRLAQERRDSIALLLQGGAATRAELREADIALDQAASAFLAARRDLGLEGSAVAGALTRRALQAEGAGPLPHRSPYGGRVLDVLVASGQIVSAGEPLVLVGRATTPKVVAYVAPSFATRFAEGGTATIRFADGTNAEARIAEPARVTRRMPADMVDQFGVRPMMVVLQLRAAEAWPASQSIHGLPVRIRFHYRWEDSGVGRLFSPALDVFAGAP